MSRKELHRLEIIQRVYEGRLFQSEAAEQLGISERQVRRLQRSYEGSGALGLTHKRVATAQVTAGCLKLI